MSTTRNSLIVIALSIAFMTSDAFATCPDFALHETEQDCPWAEASRATSSMTDPTLLRKTLDQEAPGFMTEIDRDGASKKLLGLWGLSNNVDASNLATGVKTIPANLLQYFVSIWNVPYNKDFTIGSAALNHTYGYLFSNVWTPYGFKRARYTQGEIESGFGLTPKTFSGIPEKGTLLSNLTYFAGKIAFRDSENAKSIFDDAVRTGDIVSVLELTHYAFDSLQIHRLVEVVQNDQFALELRTDIVDFPYLNTKGDDRALLIYSLDFHAPGQPSSPRLITAFPVQTSFAAELFNDKLLGDQMTVKLKYNAALPVTIPAATMVGKRFLANDSKTISPFRN